MHQTFCHDFVGAAILSAALYVAAESVASRNTDRHREVGFWLGVASVVAAIVAGLLAS